MKKFLIVATCVGMLAAAGCSDNTTNTTPATTTPPAATETQQATPNTNANTAAATTNQPVAYEITRVDDKSVGNVKSYEYYVLVKEIANEDQLQAITEKVVEKAKKDNPFNAVTVYLYDRPEYAGYASTLGTVIYTKDGDIDEADEIRTGDYANMSYDWNIKDVDWNLRPTDEEARMYTEWVNVKQSLKNAGHSITDNSVIDEMAQKMTTTTAKIKDIVDKNVDWIRQ